AEDGIRDRNVTGVQTCALPILFYQCDYFSDKIRSKLAQWVATAIDITVYGAEESNEAAAGARAGHTIADYYMNRFNTPIEEQIRSEERRVGKEYRCRRERSE